MYNINLNGYLVMSHSSRDIVALMPVYSMQIFSNFALAILTSSEQIFPLFQGSLMENGTPEVDQLQFVTLGY